MSDSWQSFLYPLGFLSSAAFLVRFLIQWVKSEQEGRCVVPRSFWLFSLLGNGLLLAHSIIQSQVHVALIQAFNGSIALRNLNLLAEQERRWSFARTLSFILVAECCTFALFLFFNGKVAQWFQSPLEGSTAAPTIHFIGCMGLLLFNSRFWLQWWYAETNSCSELPLVFWWSSLFGALLSILYFGAIWDPVNLVGPLFGLIPYLRNLLLIRREKHG